MGLGRRNGNGVGPGLVHGAGPGRLQHQCGGLCGMRAALGGWSGNCPSTVTNGSVSPTTITQCGVAAPTMPTNIVAPVYSKTNLWQQTGTYDCTNTVSTNTANVTYSVGGVQWNPSLPGTVTNTFSSTAYVMVTSSDTNKCSSPGRVNLGTVTWNLPCPTITNCTLVNFAPAGSYGANIGYNFQCNDGWYVWEIVTLPNGSPFPGQTQPTPIQINSIADQIYDPGSPSTNYTDVTYQTICFSPDGSTNATCTFANTQTIQVIQTNAPATPPHGVVITTVSIGGGFSATNSY